jgi:LemA protein
MADAALFAAVFAIVAALAAMGTYNGLKALRAEVRDAWADMDAELVRRYELLPPLVAAARATCDPTPAGLSAAVAARNRAAVAFDPQQLADAESAVTAGLRALFASPPPALAAHPSYARSRADLLAAEGRITDAGDRYNATVAAYNAALRSFPQDWAAAAFGFKPQPTFAGRAG